MMILEERVYPIRVKTPKYFLKGPVCFDWLKRAARLPGKSFHVAILIWFHSQINKKPWFYLQTKFINEFRVSRRSLYGSIKLLEQAGLIETEHIPGRKTRIRVLI